MDGIKPGVYPNMPRDEYFALEAMSQSSLKDYARSSAHWLAAQRKPRKDG